VTGITRALVFLGKSLSGLSNFDRAGPAAQRQLDLDVIHCSWNKGPTGLVIASSVPSLSARHKRVGKRAVTLAVN